ncbi:MAG: hypothetical protein WC806_05875, partial [Candidatus Gracilibacteria bacterium]
INEDTQNAIRTQLITNEADFNGLIASNAAFATDTILREKAYATIKEKISTDTELQISAETLKDFLTFAATQQNWLSQIAHNLGQYITTGAQFNALSKTGNIDTATLNQLFSALVLSEKLASADIELKNENNREKIYFTVENVANVDRSFTLNSTTKNELKNAQSKEEVLKICYGKLLDIITKDKSINKNTYSLDQIEFRNSNTQACYLKNLAEILQTQNKTMHQFESMELSAKTTIETQAREKTNNEMALRTLTYGSAKKFEGYFEITKTENEITIKALGEKSWKDIYNKMVEQWDIGGSLALPFDFPKFLEANAAQNETTLPAANTSIVMPFQNAQTEAIQTEQESPAAEQEFPAEEIQAAEHARIKRETLVHESTLAELETQTETIRSISDKTFPFNASILEKANKITQNSHGVDGDEEAGIAKLWPYLNNTEVTERTLMAAPFNVKEDDIPRVVAAIVTKGNNTELKFEDFFSTAVTGALNPYLNPRLKEIIKECHINGWGTLNSICRSKFIEKASHADMNSTDWMLMEDFLLGTIKIMESLSGMTYDPNILKNEITKEEEYTEKDDVKIKREETYSKYADELATKKTTINEDLYTKLLAGSSFTPENNIIGNYEFYNENIFAEAIASEPFHAESNEERINLFAKIIKNAKYPAISTRENKKHWITFETFFDGEIMDALKITDEVRDGIKYFNDAEEFMNSYNKLKRSTNNSTDREKVKKMESFMFGCFKILDALGIAKPSGKISSTESYYEHKEQLEEGQHEIIKGLENVFYFNETKSAINEGRLTMEEIARGANAEYSGQLRENYDPQSAIEILLNENEPKLYEIKYKKNEQTGETTPIKIIDKELLIESLNKMLDKGYMMAIAAKARKSLSKQDNSTMEAELTRMKEKYPSIEITNIGDLNHLSKFNKLALQLGFIERQSTKYTQRQEKGKKNINRQINEQLQSPKITKKLEEIRTKLEESELTQEQIEDKLAKIKSAMIIAAYYQANTKNGFDGVGIGVPIELGDGVTLIVGGGVANGPNGITPVVGVGLKVRIAKGDNWEMDLTPAVSNLGAALVCNVEGEISPGVTWGGAIGPSIGFNGSPGAVIATYFNWGKKYQEKEMRENIDNAMKNTDIKQNLDKWGATFENTNKSNYAKRMEVVEQTDSLKNFAKAMKSTFPEQFSSMSEKEQNYLILETINNYLKNAFRDAAHKEFKDFGSILTGIGFSLAFMDFTAMKGGNGITPMLGLSFNIGANKIFIPTRQSENEYLKTIAGLENQAQLEKQLRDAREGGGTLELSEITPDLYYRNGDKTMGLIKDRQVGQLSQADRNFDSYNQKLANAEVQINQHSNGTVELTLGNVEDKDAEIFIDPALAKLGLIYDPTNNRFFIKGNVEDLTISRRRIEFPSKMREKGPSIKDIITISQSSSTMGKRNELWTENMSGAFFQKSQGKKLWRMQYGLNGNAAQNNIFEIPNFAIDQVSTLETSNRDLAAIGATPNLNEQSPEIVEANQILERRNNVMGAGETIDMQKQNAENTALTEKFNKIFDYVNPQNHKKEFKEKFEKISTDTNKIKALIEEYWEKTNPETPTMDEKTIDAAVIHMINRWFTVIHPNVPERISAGLNTEGEFKIPNTDLEVLLPPQIYITNPEGKTYGNHIVYLTNNREEIVVDKTNRKIYIYDDTNNRWTYPTEIPANIKATAAKAKQDILKKEDDKTREINKKIFEKLTAYQRIFAETYKENFEKAIARRGADAIPQIGNDEAERLANIFVLDIYTNLKKTLIYQDPPKNFISLMTNNIAEGSYFFSGTRYQEDGRKYGLSETLGYTTPQKPNNIVHGFGLIEDSIKRYTLSPDTNIYKRKIAALLLETGSPQEFKKDEKFLKSPLALKLMGLDSLPYIMGNENAKYMVDLYEKLNNGATIADLLADPDHARALENFINLAKEVRKHQLDNSAYIIKNGDMTITMTPNTTINGGAYAQCANPSFTIMEDMIVTVRRVSRVGSATTIVNETTAPQYTQNAQELGVGAGVRVVAPAQQHPENHKNPPEGPPEETPPPVITKDPSQGPKEGIPAPQA